MTDMQVSKLTGTILPMAINTEIWTITWSRNLRKYSYNKKFDFQLTFVPHFDVYSHIVTVLILIGEFSPRWSFM